jgi:hypothetical protein
MEVHHHPKVENPAHGGTGKRFKEYFLEFLMIFLAVTMGFFAENIREHYTEKANGKRYLEAFRDELTQQHNTINTYKKIFQHKVIVCDSMKNIFYAGQETQKTNDIRRLLLPCLKVTEVNFHTSAYQQMVSSGALRYIKDIDLRDSMSAYNSYIAATLAYNSQITQAIIDNTVTIGSFFDLHDIVSSDTSISYDIQSHVPVVNILAPLTIEQRNRIVFFWESYVVQAQSDLRRLRSLEAANQNLLQKVNEQINK